MLRVSWLCALHLMSLPGCDFFAVEAVHPFGNLIERILYSEVAGGQVVHLGFGQILQVRLAAFRGKEDILLAPENDCFGLPFARRKACHSG